MRIADREDLVGSSARELQSLARRARATLSKALGRAQALHEPGVRELHRGELRQAIEVASQAYCAAVACGDARVIASVSATLILAHTARARDARHGASQLSQSAQRAPTHRDCEDGWRRVEAIVATCETSAAEVERLVAQMPVSEVTTADAPSSSGSKLSARQLLSCLQRDCPLELPALRQAADEAVHVARAARKTVDERNHAYTFHADPGFSFGEGWYLAAASVLAGVAIQIEPGRAQTHQAQKFLRDAGLETRLVPYRSRPRANKALPDIVARAFCAEPLLSQTRLRAAFLGSQAIPRTVRSFCDSALSGATGKSHVLVWLRHATHQPERNSTYGELSEICSLAQSRGLQPVLIGDALRGGNLPAGVLDLTLFWKLPLFQGEDMRRAQLQLFEHMKAEHGLVGQIGVTTAGMDGPALMGLPTVYLTDAPNVRLGKWVGAVPGYQEVVRRDQYLQRVATIFDSWRSG